MPEWMQPVRDKETGRTTQVKVTLSEIPTNPAERDRLVLEELKAKRYSFVEPTIGETTAEAMRTVAEFGAERAAPLIAPLVGAARGAALGFQRGAPGGPIPAFVGGLAGAGLGAATGGGVNEAVGLGLRLGQGLPPKPLPEVVESIAGEALTGIKGQLYGMAIGGAAGKFFLGAKGTVPSAARTFGIDLSAAEHSGSPVLTMLEAYTERSPLGMPVMAGFRAQQAEQMKSVAETLAARTGGAPIEEIRDVMTRANRFESALKTRISAIKRADEAKFNRYYQAAGANSPVEMTPFYAEARAIQMEKPVFDTLQSPRLNNLLTEIQEYQKAGFTTLPLEIVRNLRTALGDMAYPSSAKGVTVDFPVAAAKRLYGALKGSIETQASQKGPAVFGLLQDANQFHKTYLEGLLDGPFFKGILAGDKDLPAWTNQLFNPRDPGLLLDAKTVVNPRGWEMIRQAWWDKTLGSDVITDLGARGTGFHGDKFANAIQRDEKLLKVLFEPTQRAQIQEFADLVRPLTGAKQDQGSKLMGILVGVGQLGSAGWGIADIVSGDPTWTSAVKLGNLLGPYVAAKIFTNPEAAKMLTSVVKHLNVREALDPATASVYAQNITLMLTMGQKPREGFLTIGQGETRVPVPTPEGLIPSDVKIMEP